MTHSVPESGVLMGSSSNQTGPRLIMRLGVLAFPGLATYCELLELEAALSFIYPGALMETEENYQNDGKT